MAKAQHHTAEHRAAYTEYRKAQASGEELWCVEPVCLMVSRVIYPHQPVDVCHDTTGSYVTGPGHAKCNRSEGARRGNQARGRRKVWAL